MIASRNDLCFHEEILLLALKDEKGTTHSRASMCGYAMAGGIMAELLLAERITVDDDRRMMVAAVSAKALGEPVLDECLTRIAQARRPQGLASWVQRFARLKNLRHRVAAGLCRRGVLYAAQDRVLLIFPRRLYPERDSSFEQRIVERMGRAIFTDVQEVSPRTAVLISLANGAGLLAIPFGRSELKQRKERIEQITNGELMGRATREAVRAARAAVAAACAASVACTAAVTAATS
ncbi:MAG TPA: GPP34 family phosphoprotein [Phycisphaerae bacterium]|nr:GPP34 family phosphoprotein [Phycisphaerae bacterium]